MKIITNLLKDARDELLVRTTATINTSNAIVDRIMDDDSVEGVIMTNKEGSQSMSIQGLLTDECQRLQTGRVILWFLSHLSVVVDNTASSGRRLRASRRERYHANIRQNKHFASININTKCLPPGAPILTNVSVTGATNYGRALHKFGVLSQMYVKELNPLEEIIIIRIHTKKNEILVAPDSEFNIVVIQHARPRHKDMKGKEK